MCGISVSGLERIFEAKCQDLVLLPSANREDRFFEVLQKNCDHQVLALANAGIGPIGGATLARVLHEEKCIVGDLDLSGNLIRDAGAEALVALLRSSPTLTRLDLRSNDIGPAGGEALFHALIGNTVLKELDLGSPSGVNRNHIGVRPGDKLAEALMTNSTLSLLSLVGNGLGAESMAFVHQGLCHNTNLRVLDLSANNIRDEGAGVLCAAVSSAGIETLSLSRNMIGRVGATCVAGVLTTNMLLANLDLADNLIGAKGCTQISQALSDNTLLQSLNLERNQIGPEGASALSVALQRNRSVAVLQLGHNDIFDRGAMELALALQGNTTLAKLGLSNNKIADEGTERLAGVLSYNQYLRTLNLDANRIGDTGGGALGDALARNGTLLALYLRNNRLHDAAGERIVHGLRANSTLTCLDLTWNDLNYSNSTTIARIVADNLALHKDGAAQRYRKELERLKEEAPKLTVRLNELAKEMALVAEHERATAMCREEQQRVEDASAAHALELNRQIERVKEEEMRTESAVYAKTSELQSAKNNFEAKSTNFRRRHERVIEQRQSAEKKLASLQNDLFNLQEEQAAKRAALQEELAAQKLALEKAKNNAETQRTRLETMKAEEEAAKPVEPSKAAKPGPDSKAVPGRPGTTGKTGPGNVGRPSGAPPVPVGKPTRPTSAKPTTRPRK